MYAGDVALIAHDENLLQRMLDRVAECRQTKIVPCRPTAVKGSDINFVIGCGQVKSTHA